MKKKEAVTEIQQLQLLGSTHIVANTTWLNRVLTLTLYLMIDHRSNNLNEKTLFSKKFFNAC